MILNNIESSNHQRTTHHYHMAVKLVAAQKHSPYIHCLLVAFHPSVCISIHPSTWSSTNHTRWIAMNHHFLIMTTHHRLPTRYQGHGLSGSGLVRINTHHWPWPTHDSLSLSHDSTTFTKHQLEARWSRQHVEERWETSVGGLVAPWCWATSAKAVSELVTGVIPLSINQQLSINHQ